MMVISSKFDNCSQIPSPFSKRHVITASKRSHGDLLKQLDHHEYIVWTVKLWLNTLFTASYDCSVAHITFNLTENDIEVIQLNKIQGPSKWADAMGSDCTGQLMATHDEDTFQLEIWNLSSAKNDTSSLVLAGHTDEVFKAINDI